MMFNDLFRQGELVFFVIILILAIPLVLFATLGAKGLWFLLLPFVLYAGFRFYKFYNIKKEKEQVIKKREQSPEFLAIKNLIVSLRSSSSDDRGEAALNLGKVTNKISIPYLLEALHKEQDPLTKSIITYSLGNFEDSSLIGVFIKLLTDKADDVRKHACVALAKIPEKAAVFPLITLLDKESNPEVIEVAHETMDAILTYLNPSTNEPNIKTDH